MGLFDKPICEICGLDFLGERFKIAEKKLICPPCVKKMGLKTYPTMQTQAKLRNLTVIEIKEAMRRNELANTFSATKKIGVLAEFDDINKQFMIPKRAFWTGRITEARIYSYSDIIDFEMLEDGESVASGGLGRALVGGVLFGSVGAIVGGITGKKETKTICKSLKIKITVMDMAAPAVYIILFENDAGIRKSDKAYKDIYILAHECLSTLQLICESQKPGNEPLRSDYISNADEIMKYKELLDVGAITQEEYDAKKKQLLGL
jgi:hypothetical protein